MTTSQLSLNDDFSTVARAIVRPMLSPIDKVPHLTMIPITDPRIRNRIISLSL